MLNLLFLNFQWIVSPCEMWFCICGLSAEVVDSLIAGYMDLAKGLLGAAEN